MKYIESSNLSEMERMEKLPKALIKIKPDLAAKLRSATIEEITQLERLHGRALPPWYRLYLEKMGHGIGEFQYFLRGSFELAEILKLLEKLDPQPLRYFMVGVDASGYGCEQDIYVDLEDSGKGTAVLVGYIEKGSGANFTLHGSRFSSYLLSIVTYEAIQSMKRSGRGLFEKDASCQLAQLTEVLEKEGVHEHELSGTWHKVYIGPGCKIEACEWGGTLLPLNMGCETPEIWSQMSKRLERELKVEFKLQN